MDDGRDAVGFNRIQRAECCDIDARDALDLDLVILGGKI